MIPISGLAFAAALSGGVGLMLSTSLAGAAAVPHLELVAAAGALAYSLVGLTALRALTQPGIERSIALPELPAMKDAA